MSHQSVQRLDDTVQGYPTPSSDQSNWLAATRIVDAPPEDAFDKFTRLVSRTLHAPVALVSVVEEDRQRQFFKSEVGLGGIWARKRQTPLSHSFCQFVKRDNRPLIVTDAPADARVCDNLAVPELGVRAYLGVPFHDCRGEALGALCAIDTTPRDWSEEDVELITDIAACVTDLVCLRTALQWPAHG